MKVFGEEYALIYDFLYQDKNYEQECDFIESVFAKFSGNVERVLDLGCGTGGHDLILAKRGYHVVGIDHSQEMLEIAKRKAKDADLSLEFVKHDIKKLNLQNQFDAVISMFAVMSYQTTNSALSQVCKTAREHLVQGGIFLFDCWYGPAVLTEKPSIRIKEVKLNEEQRVIRFTEPILNTLTHTVEIRFKVWKIQGSNLISEINESHIMRFLFPQEIRYFLEIAGFNEIEFCPFPELEKQLKEHEWNVAVIAKLR